MRKHRDTACIEILVPGGQDGQAEARMAAAFGWLSTGSRRSRCVAAFPVDLPGGDQQMTLAVGLPLRARWSSARLQAVIGEVLGQLDEAGIGYSLIEVEAGDLVYLPKDVTGG
jgi:hypothetical protein